MHFKNNEFLAKFITKLFWPKKMMCILDSCAVHIYIRLPEIVNNIFQNS